MKNYTQTAIATKDRWKLIRSSKNISNDGIDDVFNILISSNLFDSKNIQELEIMEKCEQHLLSVKSISSLILHTNKKVINYEVDIDCWTHPIDFDDYFNSQILPILDQDGIKDISLKSKATKVGGECEYEIEIFTSLKKIKIITDNTTDYLNDFYSALNTIMDELNTKKRFVDIDGIAKGFFDPNIIKGISENLGVTIND